MGACKSLFVAVALAALFVAVPRTASADLSACGNIHVEASASCELVASGGCETQCEPVNFRAACAAELNVECEGECDAEVTTECMDNCDIDSCTTECTLDPGSFSCEAECSASISGQCSAECEGTVGDDEAHGECVASCEASFSAECSGGCSGTGPSVSCETQCMKVCESVCTHEANVDCRVDCQADGYAGCYTRLEGGCTTACSEPMGALFCDDQYVDHGGNLAECIESLRDSIDIDVDVSAVCEGGTCSFDGTVSAGGCAVSPGTSARALPVAIGFFGILGIISRRRRL